jgi:monoterpene epsilon-lactone hydrolase
VLAMMDGMDGFTADTTIDAGPVLKLMVRMADPLMGGALTPRLDLAAMRRGDARRPPGRMCGCRISPVPIKGESGAPVLVGEITPPQPPRQHAPTLVYVHGGAYVAGPIRLEWYLAATLCRDLEVRTLVPLYRRAPEHPFPAGYDDIVSVLDGLAEHAAGPVLLAGGSAGGGLAAAIAAHRGGIARLALISPWVDLALDAEDLDDSRDTILALPGLREAARLYAGDHDLDDARVSPLHAALTALPPTIVQASTDEVFLPDIRRFTERARTAGADVHHVEGRGLPHGWSALPLAPQAATARRLLVEHLSR